MYITTQYFTTSISGPAPTHWLSAVKIKRKVFTKMDRMFAHSLWVRNRNPNIYIYILYIHTYTHTLHYITWHCVPLHYITLHYITLHCIALHYITLHYITLHCIALHTYTYTYIHVCIYIHIYMYLHIHKYIPMTQTTFEGGQWNRSATHLLKAFQIRRVLPPQVHFPGKMGR